MLIKSSRRGQAILELLGAAIILVFLMLISLDYFRFMRSAVIRQEVVRNLAFLEINNAGSLVSDFNTRTNIASLTSLPPRYLSFEGGAADLEVRVDDREMIDGAAACIRVDMSGQSREPSLGGIMGLVPKKDVKILTKAVVYRQPAASCQ